MKLFRATIEFDMVVYAENENDAVALINDHAREELDNEVFIGRKSYIFEVEKIKDLPKNWENAIPWSNNSEDKTCSQILEGSKNEID